MSKALMRKGADSVAEYFKHQASSYQSSSLRWPWSAIRRVEGEAVARALGDLQNATVLELGCGAGYYTRLLLDRGAAWVYAVDFASEMLEQLPRERVTAIRGDASLVTCERSVSTILSAGMLEFVPDAAAVLANAHKQAEPGATFAILVPRRSLLGRAYQQFHAKHGFRIQLFETTGLTNLAAQTGWHIDWVEPVWPFSLVARLRRS